MLLKINTAQQSTQAYLRDIVGQVPDHSNKANIATKRVTQIFWFPSAKSYVYTML